MGNQCCNSKKTDNTPSDMKDFKKEMKDDVESDDNDLTTKTASKEADQIISSSPKQDSGMALGIMYEEL